MRNLSVVIVGAVLASACSGSEAPPFKPIADTKLLMNAVIDPAADHVWESAGTIITAEGREELGPKNAEEWAALHNSAVALAESGNLLMMVPRGRDEEWMRLSQALVDTGVSAMRAAEAKNVEQVFNAGADIYQVCNNCHSKYALELVRQ